MSYKIIFFIFSPLLTSPISTGEESLNPPPAQSARSAFLCPNLSTANRPGQAAPACNSVPPLNSFKGRTGRVYKNHLNCHCEKTARSTRQSSLIFMDRHADYYPLAMTTFCSSLPLRQLYLHAVHFKPQSTNR